MTPDVEPPKRDIVGMLRRLERHGEDNIWRTAKDAREEIERLRAALVAADNAIQEAAADMMGYCGKDPERLAEPLRRAADARIAIRAALTPN